MNCEQARAAYSRTLDGEPDSLEALRHGMLCAGCSAWARQLHHLDDALHDELGGIEDAPAGFADRLLARLPDESPEELAAAEEAPRGDTAGWLVSVAALVAAFEWGGSLGGLAGAWDRAVPLAQRTWAWVLDFPAALAEVTPTAAPAPEAWSWTLSVEPVTLGVALAVAAALPLVAGRGLARERREAGRA